MTYRKPCKTCGTLVDKYEAMQVALRHLIRDFFEQAADPVVQNLEEIFGIEVDKATVKKWLEGRMIAHLALETKDAKYIAPDN